MIWNRQEGLGESQFYSLVNQAVFVLMVRETKSGLKKESDHYTTITVITAAVYLVLTVYQVLC